MKLNFDLVDPRERGSLMLRWRRAFGWSVADAGRMIGTSTRTVAAIESGAQLMTDEKWTRLVSHVPDSQEMASPAELVVVLSPEQAPIDVVSSDNFEALEVADDQYSAIIASRAVDRTSGAPYLHRQRFLVRGNEHVLRAAMRWQAAADARDLSTAEHAHRWMMRRVLQGELKNPQLTELKRAVSAANEELKGLGLDGDEGERQRLIRKLDIAIAELMQEAAKGVLV